MSGLGGKSSTVREYWERRLEQQFSLAGVGYAGLGVNYNAWLYRVRAGVIKRVVREFSGPLRDYDVLDIGSGTGFYVDLWTKEGAKSVTALDVTAVAVRGLRERFPHARVVQADIAGAELNDIGPFDLVSAIDVLFHLLDDKSYYAALRNIARVTHPGGLLVLSENFLHGDSVRTAYQANRTLDFIRDALQSSGFEPLVRVPMFVLMNYPLDTTSALARLAWRAMVAPARLSDRAGHLLGALLYPLEVRLIESVKEGPSTELMVCRRVDA